MTIQYKVSEESFDTLDDSVKGLYSQGEDGYTLNVDGVPKEDVSGLKRKIDELLTEKKTVQQKAIEANDFEQLYNSSESERQKAVDELATLKANLQQQQVEGQASKVAASLTKDTARANLLSQQISSRLSLVDGEVRVLDTNGNLTVSSVEELTQSIKAEYPFLVDGSQAAGGGATGGSSGAGDTKQVSRSDFDAMDAVKRMKYIKSGGKII